MSKESEQLKEQYGIGTKKEFLDYFPVSDIDKGKIRKCSIKTAKGNIESYCCPYCFPNNDPVDRDDWRFNNIDKDIEIVYVHMMICSKNPLAIKYKNELRTEYDRLFKKFGFKDGKEKASSINPKFLMGAAFYHIAMSKPESTVHDLIMVTHETDEAYLGNFVFGIGMFHVIFPKKNGNVRELNKKEIKEYHGQNIAISNNPACASLNIKENKYDQPITKQ